MTKDKIRLLVQAFDALAMRWEDEVLPGRNERWRDYVAYVHKIVPVGSSDVLLIPNPFRLKFRFNMKEHVFLVVGDEISYKVQT
jgi:hypothetical protein